MALTLEQRFWSKVKKTKTCWLWLGGLSPRGYGKFWNNGDMRAHRQSWILTHGVIPTGSIICHTCDNPTCVNPQHLFLGTVESNNKDCAIKGRTARGAKNGAHKLTDDEVLALRANEQDLTIVQLALVYGISGTMVKHIRARRFWAHI